MNFGEIHSGHSFSGSSHGLAALNERHLAALRTDPWAVAAFPLQGRRAVLFGCVNFSLSSMGVVQTSVLRMPEPNKWW